MPIFLTPSGVPLSGLVDELRNRLHCLTLNVIDEDLAVLDSYVNYQAENKQWLSFPVPRVRKIDVNASETLLIPTTDYTIDSDEGKLTLVVAATADDTIRVDYTYDVFTDDDLENFLIQSAREIINLLHRKVDTAAVHDNYKEVIMKRAYTNAFKCLLQPTFNFFSVSIDGRAIDKTNLGTAIKLIIDTNEEILDQEINSLRLFNQTNRFE